MAENLLRQGQLIGTFGPGSFVDLPDRSVIISGLADWDKRAENRITEPRLLAYLRRRLEIPELQLFSPPEFDSAPDAPKLGVAGLIYPTWFVTQDRAADPGRYGRRRLVRIQATDRHGLWYQDPEDRKKKSLTPIRFVCACRKGHTSDVDWKTYVHRGQTDCQRTLWLEERGTSGEVADTWVGCDCGQKRQLYEALDSSSQPLGWCNGARPWLGPYQNQDDCKQPNRLLVRSASNAYFAEVISTISLPDASDEFGKNLGDALELIKNVTTESELEMLKKLLPPVSALLAKVSNDQVLEFLHSRNADDAATVSVKEAEFDVLVSGIVGRDEPDSNYFAETLERTEWDPNAAPYLEAIDRVVLVHRLREVVAQVGFTRFEPISTDIDGELDGGVERQDLADPVTWLPAIEHRGEGVFFQVSAAAIASWRERENVFGHIGELVAGYRLWSAEKKLDRPFVGAPYILLHSLSHLLIGAIALECGYPATSLRERIYAIRDSKFGILIHTGSSGSEGTLGGVVAAGRRIAEHLRRALINGRFCSNDPVCADHQASSQLEQRYLHGAACHGCLLIAEPSCEHRNDLLDRTLVVGTVRTQDAAFFPSVSGV